MHGKNNVSLHKMKFPTTLFLLFFFPGFISSQDNALLVQSYTLQNSSTVLSVSDSAILSYNEQHVFKNGNSIYEISKGRIIKVLANKLPDLLMVVSLIIPKNKEQAILTFQHISNFAIRNSPWQIEIPYDSGIPNIIIFNEQIFILWAESQSYSVFNVNGELIGKFNLFGESPWTTEKVILSQSHNSQLYFLGMKTAKLNSRNNVTFFQLKESLESKPSVTFDMVQPYFTSISPNNILSVVGTTNPTERINPIPHLTLFDLNNLNKIMSMPLAVMPRKVIWINKQLALIYKDGVTIYDPSKIMDPIKIKFDDEVFPMECMNYDNLLLILTSKSLSPSPNGLFYDNIKLLQYNFLKETLTTHEISNKSYKNVKFSKIDNSDTFFIQLDNTIHRYDLAN